MPFLRRLDIKLPRAEKGDLAGFAFPATLSCVYLTVEREYVSVAAAAGLQALLFALASHVPLTELRISVSSHLHASVSLAPLQRLERLHSLSIRRTGTRNTQGADTHLCELHMLTHVKKLRVGLQENALLRLLQAPCERPQQWRVNDMGAGSTAEVSKRKRREQ